MWKCKECGNEDFQVEGIMDFPDIDNCGAIRNCGHFEPRVYICQACGAEEDTIEELAKWEEE